MAIKCLHKQRNNAWSEVFLAEGFVKQLEIVQQNVDGVSCDLFAFGQRFDASPDVFCKVLIGYILLLSNIQHQVNDAGHEMVKFEQVQQQGDYSSLQNDFIIVVDDIA